MFGICGHTLIASHTQITSTGTPTDQLRPNERVRGRNQGSGRWSTGKLLNAHVHVYQIFSLLDIGTRQVILNKTSNFQPTLRF